MQLFDFLRREAELPVRRLLLGTILAGAATVMLLVVVNYGALHVDTGAHSLPLLLAFLAGLVLHSVAQERSIGQAMEEIEHVLHRVRVRLAQKVRGASLLALDRIGRAEIFASIDKETRAISEASLMLVLGGQAAVLVLLASLYLAWLSWIAFALALPFIVAAVLINLRKERRQRDALRRGLAVENELFEAVTDLASGFEAVKLHQGRSNALQANIALLSGSARDQRTRARTSLATTFVSSQANFYLLVGAMVFLVPRLVPTFEAVVLQTTTTALFVLGPIFSALRALPELSLANVASENICRLEARLDDAAHHASSRAARSSEAESVDKQTFVAREVFERIELESVAFRYRTPAGEMTFEVGPIDLTLRRGETVVITGGNGSGKSTLLRILTGLYVPEGGTLRVDGEKVGVDETYDRYRSLFSVIFTDNHLFRKLYGLANVDRTRLDALLDDMELASKTGVEAGPAESDVAETAAAEGRSAERLTFETLALSSGQRKRLALILSLLEDKPIYVFDEWAVHQEPAFRRRFYREILDQLKAAGKTVVVVTHDERYFDVAERHLVMRDGRLHDVSEARDEDSR